MECLGVFENSYSPDVHSIRCLLALGAAYVQIHIFCTYHVFEFTWANQLAEKTHLHKVEKFCTLTLEKWCGFVFTFVCVFLVKLLPSETEPNVCVWVLARQVRPSGSMITSDVLPNSRITVQNALGFLVKHLWLRVNHRKLEKKGFPCFQNRETEGGVGLSLEPPASHYHDLEEWNQW